MSFWVDKVGLWPFCHHLGRSCGSVNTWQQGAKASVNVRCSVLTILADVSMV